MPDVTNINTVNCVLVEIEKSQEVKTSSGIFLVENEKPQNFGKVISLPKTLTESYKDYTELVNTLHEGDVVFFNPKHSYATVQLDSLERGKAYMFIPLDMVLAVYQEKSKAP
ncbi:MAG: co-chaperone GroES family protein [Thermoproteota archaeon]